MTAELGVAPDARTGSLTRPPRTVLGKVAGCLRLARELSRDDRVGTTPVAQARLEANRFLSISTRACALHGLDIRWKGPRPQEVGIVVCNHRSFIDPLILGTLLPAAPISKAEVLDWPVVGPSAAKMGTIPVERDDPMHCAQALRRARWLLAAGVHVINFPEGTTTEGEMAPFKRGLFGIARHLNVPVHPVFLDLPEALNWVGASYFLPHYLRFARRRRTEVTLTLGAPIPAHESSSAEDLAARTRAAIEALQISAQA